MESIPPKKRREPPMSIRPTAGQRAAILERAAAAGMSVNAYALSCMLSGAASAPKPPPRFDPDTLAMLRGVRADLGRLGNVVNQLAHTAHLGQLDNGAEVGPLLVAKVAALSDSVLAALTTLSRVGTRQRVPK